MSDSTENLRGPNIPKIPRDLIEALELAMPELDPKIDWPDRKIFFEVGRRAYLRHLRVLFDRQQEDRTVL